MRFFDRYQDVEDKVWEVFVRFGDLRQRLDGSSQARIPMDRIVKALRRKHGEAKAEDIAFHLCDWSAEAAFIVALLLAPEKLTLKQIRDGIGLLLIHAPNHLMAAATLHGDELRDVWDLGVAVEPPLPSPMGQQGPTTPPQAPDPTP